MDIAMVPFERDPTFVGRADILRQMSDSLKTKQRVILKGEDSIGKTHIAIEYAHQFQTAHPNAHVFWCPASFPEELDNSYKAIARQLLLPSQVNLSQAVYDWLEDASNGPWLLIADDVSPWGKAREALILPTQKGGKFADVGKDGVLLSGYLPYQHKDGQIVITTQYAMVAQALEGKEGVVIEVPPLSREELNEILRRNIPEGSWSESASQEVIDAVGSTPHAIRIAGAFITENDITLSEYLDKLLAIEPWMKPTKDKDYRQLQAELCLHACRPSIDQIHEGDPRAAELLFLMSTLYGVSIPKTLLIRPDDNPRQFNRAFDTLQGFGLVTSLHGGTNVALKDAVQAAVVIWLMKKDLWDSWVAAAIDLLARKFPYGTNIEWSTCENLYFHVFQVIREEPKSPTQILQLATLLRNVAEYHYTHGNYAEAAELNTKALVFQEKHLGESHVDTLLTANKLFEVLRAKGQYKEAETLCRQTLERREATLGPEHPHTITSISNLAVVVQDQSRYAEAETLHRSALALNEKIRGPDDANTLTSLMNLGYLLKVQGQLDEAERLNRRSLEGSERVLGKDDAGTLTVVNNLAGILDAQGKVVEAEAMNRRVLVAREAMLGADHPDTLTSMNNLATILAKGGRYSEAEPLHRKVLESRERTMGAEHPSTLISVNNLALCLTWQGKYADAEAMHRRTFAVRKESLGEEHLDTVTGMNNLAGLLGLQGKYVEAEELHRKCLKVRSEMLGPAHPATLGSMNNLGKVLLMQDGKLEEAEALLRERLRLGETMGEEENPGSLMSRNNLALVLAAKGKPEEAEEMHREVLESRERVLGPEHPDTLTSAFNLATMMYGTGKYDEAGELYKRACAGRKHKLGADHPDTVAAEAAWSRMQQEALRSNENVAAKKDAPQPGDAPVQEDGLSLPVRTASANNNRDA